MITKRIITVCLLLFVGATLVALAANAFRSTDEAVPAASSGDAQPARRELMVQDGMIAYYFHGDTRCPTCRTIEALACEAIETGFAQELADGKIQWRVRNYEKPENEGAVDRYQIVAPIVVLSKMQGGAETAWVSLEQVWQLTHDKAEFAEYVRGEVKKLLDERTG